MDRRLRRLAALLAGLTLILTPVAARADSGLLLMRGYSIMTGYFYETGMGELSAYQDLGVGPTATGISFYERQGLISGWIFAIATIVAGAYAENMPKSVETTYSGNWKITKYTYYSEAEKAAMRAATAAAAQGYVSTTDQSFELQLFSRNLPGIAGETSGHKLNMYFGFPLNDNVMLDLGFGWGKIHSKILDDGREIRLENSYIGMPFRLNVAFDNFMTYLAWDWNWAGHQDKKEGQTEDKLDWTSHGIKGKDKKLYRDLRPFPLRLGAITAWGRFFGEVVATTPSVDSFKVGVRGAAGLRF